MNRPIIPQYFERLHKAPVRTNHSKHARTAVLNALDHLTQEHYAGAFIAVVTDENTGELHAILKADLHGKVSVMFKRDPKSPMCLT